MNAPDRYEKFVVPEGVQKCAPHERVYQDAVVLRRLTQAVCCARISLEKDTKVLNAATFTLQREDHTVGNLLRMCATAAVPGAWMGCVCASQCIAALLCSPAASVSSLNWRPASSWSASCKLRLRPARGLWLYACHQLAEVASMRCNGRTRCFAEAVDRRG